jgi:hypothetical protein
LRQTARGRHMAEVILAELAILGLVGLLHRVFDERDRK